MSSKFRTLWQAAGSRQGEKGRLRQFAEMTALLALYGQGSGYYQIARFWRRDIGWQEMTQHLGARGYAKRLVRLNPVKFRKFSQHKLVEKAIFTMAHVPTAPFLGFIDRYGGFTPDDAPLCNADDFKRFLNGIGPVRFCYKEVQGRAGQQVGLREHTTDEMLRDIVTGDTQEPAEFFARLDVDKGRSYLVEAYITQHPVTMAFNPSSVNTLRMWAIQKDDGVRILSCVLRVGRQGAVIDNLSSGGLASVADIETGVLGPLCKPDTTLRHFPSQPDHGAEIEGQTIPWFAEAKAAAELALLRMPELNFACVNVAITPDGPLIIDLNVVPDREHAALVGIPTATVL